MNLGSSEPGGLTGAQAFSRAGPLRSEWHTAGRLFKRLLARNIIAGTSPYAITYALAPGLIDTPEQVEQAVREVSG